MLRLALNLASTRLILAHGHEGTTAAGHVIAAFGNFVMGGNYVIGLIVFTILVIVNFVVITKGSQHVTPAGSLPIIALTAKWEQAFAESIVGQGDDRNLAMQPSKLTEFINLVREKFEQAARDGEAPVLVTSPGIRPFVRGIIEVSARRPVCSRSRKFTRGRG